MLVIHSLHLFKKTQLYFPTIDMHDDFLIDDKKTHILFSPKKVMALCHYSTNVFEVTRT